MIKISRRLFYLFNVLLWITTIRAVKELEAYSEIKNIISKFDSLTSDPATIFSVYLNDNGTGVESRKQFFDDLAKNRKNIQNFGDFPYHPTGEVDQTEYKTLERKANENRNIIINQIDAIEAALKYLNDILERYQYMTPEDKKEQSMTVVKYILGQTVLPEEALPVRLSALSSRDCMNWLESELQLLSFQYENNDPANKVDFEDYSRINLSQCINYVTTGYSMIISAKQAQGDADAEKFYEKYSIDTSELIKNHEELIRKKSANSNRKANMLNDMYETDAGFTMSNVISYIFIITHLLIFFLFP
ncbi:hypothetical protein BCR36DRAFT_404038 [Piromyces finnis]|uniref:Uncharacterized protein n=1 Tax=Piromyces finnis TaxID=1754191 RepID=A0A1Y1VBI2_9FUNG|nr:hypothetical protein BCR36DRAFT_404038 [Piromyces finnis]|eukprot:ORX51815.1 hypothetical protein BCR36DRAFT_404038 [Piromyces finnis]